MRTLAGDEFILFGPVKIWLYYVRTSRDSAPKPKLLFVASTFVEVTVPLQMPRGPITRARAKKFKEVLLNLMKTNYLKDFEDDEMKEGTGYTTYACMTIDTVARLTDPLELPRGPITRARAKKPSLI